jgi:hypothetical protein
VNDINFRKGLFRIWIFCSTCWVFFVIFFHNENITFKYVGYYNPIYAQGLEGLPPLPKGCCDLSQEEKVRFEKCKNSKDLPDIFLFCDEKPKNEYAIKVEIIEWHNLVRLLKWSLLPPLIALILAYGIRWVSRGFDNEVS